MDRQAEASNGREWAQAHDRPMRRLQRREPRLWARGWVKPAPSR